MSAIARCATLAIFRLVSHALSRTANGTSLLSATTRQGRAARNTMDRLSYCGIAGSSSTSLSRPNASANLVTSGQKAPQAWHPGL
ncbi:uncharacterized protein TrAtP1_002334 [Trichoderma atroviride]|uniref:uncharacterized protein n=1 Tax=Hypocrea atroviridis TaxID=63577 RepID=UPI00332AEC25|nr:hypothetical protein TrAtP1_002334 [Trichoderma atroviride]